MEVKEESFWKFIVACLMTGNNTLAKELIKQNKDLVMKSNEAPEKIYLQENTTTDCYDEFWPEWFEARAKDTDIEYTRTDAFIEKAVEWLENHNDYIDVKDGNVTYFDMEKCVEDFKNYMKGGEQ